LWHLDSSLSRADYRKYILSDYFAPSLESMLTVMLVHRVQAHQRDILETDADSVRVRNECCKGTVYDIPTAGKSCREVAKFQCKVAGDDRFNFMQMRYEDGKRKGMVPASRNASEYLVMMYMEPLELNPGPMGLDFFSMPDRRAGFLDADESGEKGMTTRMLRAFADTSEFGLLVWNNLFIDLSVDANKTLYHGVKLAKKERIIAAGGTPYSLASVVAVYRIQVLLENVITKVFGAEVGQTQIFLFDDRPSTGERQRLMAMYDQSLTPSQRSNRAVAIGDKTKAELTDAESAQINSFKVKGTQSAFSVAVVPTERYMATHTSEYPYFILMISLLLVAVAQLERWCGHPILISSYTLKQARIEEELRAKVESSIVEIAAARADAQEKCDIACEEFVPC
jgi:hypothetical protein